MSTATPIDSDPNNNTTNVTLTDNEDQIHTFGKVSVRAKVTAEPPESVVAASANSLNQNNNIDDDEDVQDANPDEPGSDDDDDADLMAGVSDDVEDLDFTHARIGDLAKLNIARLK
ncbi:hypothetical protein HDU79_003027, partial [Rhizoclosmatium sp. JEL0117]